MKPYPLELRERIVSSVDEKIHTIAELAELFQVTERYIYKLLKLRRETGDLTPLPHSGGGEPILNEQRLLVIADLVAAYPEATLQEYRARIQTHCGVRVCLTTVWAAMEKSAFTRKKTRRAQEAEPTERAAFSKKQKTLPAARLWFIDEFGVHLNMARRYCAGTKRRTRGRLRTG